jgi:hypothetical protein
VLWFFGIVGIVFESLLKMRYLIQDLDKMVLEGLGGLGNNLKFGLRMLLVKGKSTPVNNT